MTHKQGWSVRASGVALAALVGLSGCPSFMSVQTARALDKGELEVTEAASVLGMTGNGQQANAGGVTPDIYFSTRYGLADGWDIGARLEPAMGFIGTTTVQLHHGDTLDLAIAPDLGFVKFPGPIAIGTNASISALSLTYNYSVVPIDVPLLIGINLKNDHQIVLGPRISGWVSIPQAFYQPGSTSPAQTAGGLQIFAGGTAGVSFRASRSIRVMPEIDVTVPVAWTGQGPPSGGDVNCGLISCSPFPMGSVIWQFAVGITYGVSGTENGYL